MWRPVDGKPGVFVHDEAPRREVEIIEYVCPGCGEEQTTYHGQEATDEERAAHRVCMFCGGQLAPRATP